RKNKTTPIAWTRLLSYNESNFTREGSSLNINQLETLIAISKTMSFRKAGELLNLTQPAVSAQIKSLEDEFQTVLVDRNQPVTLTDSGKVFLEHAEQMLKIVEE